jgi:FkbM family methyltransferase
MNKKKILLAILGEKRYLFLVANVFQRLYRIGALGKEYQDIYFLKKFIRSGDWCIDIGAHLGYFSLELSRLVKSQGKVFAVEPMSKFNRVLERLLAIYKIHNVTIYRVALGGKGEYVEMGIPEVDQSKKFAYARVMESSPGLQYIESEKVVNKSGDELFNELTRLDFVKCDVEGLEYPVFLSMMATLKTHHPILLCEFFDRNERIKLYELLLPLGYQVFQLDKHKWHALDVYAEGNIASQNYYFIPAGQRERLKHLFQPKV